MAFKRKKERNPEKSDHRQQMMMQITQSKSYCEAR